MLRHFHEFEAYCTQTGVYFIEHKGLVISFPDLQGALSSLSPRKKEAVLLNVIYDLKQKDVAAIMGITTVSVGQYVETGVIQIAKKYFGDDEEGGDDNDVSPVPSVPPKPPLGGERESVQAEPERVV